MSSTKNHKVINLPNNYVAKYIVEVKKEKTVENLVFSAR